MNEREFLNILDVYYNQDEEIYNLYNYQNSSLIDIWSPKKGFLYNNNLYPINNNFHEITIRITGFNYLPYVIFGAQKSFGIDINLLKLFSTIYNASLIILQEKEENWQRLYELVRENQADVALGGFQLTRIYKDLDLTTVYYYTKFKALVPKPKLLQGTLAPFRALSPGSWIILTLLFITFIVIITLIIYKSQFYQKSNIIKSWLAIYGMFFSQSPSIPSILLTFKSIFVWVHLTSFIVASIYNSGAASILIVPSYERAINSIEELIECDLKLGTFNIEEFSLPLSSSEFVIFNFY
nr:uncharacterized protein LOC111427345 [Onthophagus taurus]